LLAAADTDKSGQIDYTEFIAATMEAQIFLRNDYLRTAFDMFDKDKSGKIDVSEIMLMLGEDGMQDINVSKEQLLKYIAEVDENGDGEIDFDEFCTMMSKCQNL
jgi:calcium-dependent protein kinase